MQSSRRLKVFRFNILRMPLKSGIFFLFYMLVKNMSALTTKEFIKKAKEIHGDKYDYSKVEYVNTLTPVTII